MTARWLLRRGIQTLYPEVVKTIDWANGKFDARIELTSPAAAALKVDAEKLVDVYLENCDLAFEEENNVAALFIELSSSLTFSLSEPHL